MLAVRLFAREAIRNRSGEDMAQVRPGGFCRSMTIQANIGLETSACGEGVTATQANEIADRIMAPFPS